MAPGPFSRYNSSYGRAPYGQPPSDSIMERVVKPNIVVFSIIVTCAIVFALEMIYIYQDKTESLLPFTMVPNRPMPWMFVTSVFMHADYYHLFFNMFMLFIFGMTLERMIGHKMFLGLFLAAGVMGNVGYVLFCLVSGSNTPALGASGAIYGVFACMAILAPDTRVYLFFFVPMKIIHALMLYAAIDILFLNSQTGIAHSAHLAGLVVGLAFAFYIKKKVAEARAYNVSYSFKPGY